MVLFSCVGHLSPPQESDPAKDLHSYCDLLALPPKPYSPLQPKPYLGVYLASRKVETVYPECKDNIFIQIAGVMLGSPAAKAGLQEDDIVLTFGGKPTCVHEGEIISSFRKMIERQKIGVQVTMDIVRKDHNISVSPVLEEIPTHDQPEARHPELEKCPDRDSLLQQGLSAQNALPLFNSITNELYRKSNLVHNPDMASEQMFDPLQLKEVTYLLRHPQAAGAVAKELSERISSPLEQPHWDAGTVVRKAAALLDIELSSSPIPTAVTFPALLEAMEASKKRVEEALGNLTTEEKSLLRKAANDPADDMLRNRVLEISMKIDRARLFNACSPLLFFLTQDNLALLKKDITKRFASQKGPLLYEAETPIGKVLVGGEGPNVYSEDAALIVDLGGDDLYLNNAGGTRPGMPVALVIDFGGNNRYLGKDNFSQGAGLLGCGFLVDLGGETTFRALSESQGAGFWGMGFLYHGDGNAVYSASRFSQGTGQMGLGLMISGRGNDSYLCSFSGQGLGLFGGAGILIDEGGNDFYHLGGSEPDFRDPLKASQSFGQGFGMGVASEKDIRAIPGGIGMLIDLKGDDTYIADYFAQGSSYYYGLGILDDRAGNDQYIAGRYAQGAGIHSSVGVLIDRQGNDFYYSSYGVAQGLGHDYGIGFLEDDEGENRYQGGILVQGAATNNGLGILIDPKGPNKQSYQSNGQAFTTEESGIGIMIHRGQGPSFIVELGIKKE